MLGRANTRLRDPRVKSPGGSDAAIQSPEMRPFKAFAGVATLDGVCALKGAFL